MKTSWKDAVALLGRIFISGIFLQAVLGKTLGWNGQAAYMAAHGMHFVTPLLGAALLIEVVGTACILSGYRASTAAMIMSAYLLIVTLRLHNFWSLEGDRAAMMQTEFMKNLAIIGGLFIIAAFGPGRFALGRPRMAELR
jgi:putative oxidoreductase